MFVSIKILVQEVLSGSVILENSREVDGSLPNCHRTPQLYYCGIFIVFVRSLQCYQNRRVSGFLRNTLNLRFTENIPYFSKAEYKSKLVG